jgi:3-hydroxyisobutyrate dehydrogenase-like beta-hydroxyacid dehydrogenase
MIQEISFIGLGAMGVPIVNNLLEDGFTVHIYNRTQEVSKTFVDNLSSDLCKHVSIANSPKEVLKANKEKNRIVISIVSNDLALESICNDENGILSEISEGDVHLCLSTVSPNCVTRLEELHKMKSAVFISCPVFGRPPVAASRKLIVVAAGESSGFAKVENILQKLSQKVVYAGPKASQACVLKLSGNFCILSMIEMFAEAFTLAEGHDISREVAFDLLTGADGVFTKIPIMQTYAGIVRDHSYNNVGFAAINGLKDAKLIKAAAVEGHLNDTPFIDVVNQRLKKVVEDSEDGGKNIDWSSFAAHVKVTK